MLEDPTTAAPREALQPPARPVVEAAGLEMRYGSNEALRGVDLEITHGEILAVVGPNGAGKTTMIEILEGFREPTGGEVTVLGEVPHRAGPEWRGRIGVVLQRSEPERELTAFECLSLYAGYYAAPRSVEDTLALVGLAEQADVPCGRLSGGQQRRIDVALALIGNPELIFLDEPTTGFDPAARRAAWHMIDGLRELDASILLTTHDMQEAEQLADRIVVLRDGRIVAEGTPQSLGGRDAADTTIAFDLPLARTVEDLPPNLAAIARTDGGHRVILTSRTPLADLRDLLAWADGDGELRNLRVDRPTLEDIYLRLTTGSDG